MKQEIVTVAITITKEQKAYIDSREDLNLSGYVRMKIDELIKNGQ